MDLNCDNNNNSETKYSDNQRVESIDRRVKHLKRLVRKTQQKLNKISVFNTKKNIKFVDNYAIITDKSMNKIKTKLKSIEMRGREVVPTSDLVPICGPESDFKTPNNKLCEKVVLKSILKNSTNCVSNPPKKRSRIIRQLFVNELTLSEINCETKMEIKFKSLSDESNVDQNNENSNPKSNSQQISDQNKLPKKKKFNTEKTFRIKLDFIGKHLVNSDNTNEVKKSNDKQLKNNTEFVDTNEIIDGKVVVNGNEFVPVIELSAEDLISLNELIDPELPSISNNCFKNFDKFGAQKLENIRKLEEEVKRKENEIQRLKDLIEDTPNRHHQMWVRAKLDKYCPHCENQVLTSKFKLTDFQTKGVEYFCSAQCLDQFWNCKKGTVALLETALTVSKSQFSENAINEDNDDNDFEDMTSEDNDDNQSFDSNFGFTIEE